MNHVSFYESDYNLVYLVSHANKLAGDKYNPSISAKGRSRHRNGNDLSLASGEAAVWLRHRDSHFKWGRVHFIPTAVRCGQPATLNFSSPKAAFFSFNLRNRAFQVFDCSRVEDKVVTLSPVLHLPQRGGYKSLGPTTGANILCKFPFLISH